MYFTKFEEGYLPAAAQLEANNYSQEIAQGLKEFEEKMQKRHFRYLSVAGFSKGKMVCYVTAYREENLDVNGNVCIYISDVNCSNPAYLKRLLLKFFAGAKADCGWTPSVFLAHMRSSSYRLIQGEKKRKSRGVTVLEEQWIPRYYPNGEGAYQIKFTVDYKRVLKHSWKDEFQLWIDQMHYYDRLDILRYAFEWFYDSDRDSVQLYEKKNQRFVLNCIKEALLDYYAMFSSHILVEVTKALPMRIQNGSGAERYEKTIATYEGYGFTKNQGEKRYHYSRFMKCLNVYEKREVYHTRYPEQLSGIRWFWRRQMAFLRKNKVSVSYFNHYGILHAPVKVPYLTERYYLYLVDKMYFIRRMEQELELKETCHINDREYFRFMCNRVYYLLPGKEARECIRGIASRWKASSLNYFHDWNLCVSILTEAKHILTAGAVKRILTKSYNHALGVSKSVDSVLKVIELAKKMREPFDIKELRKEFSSMIRRDKDCVAYVNRLYYEKESKYRSKLQLPASQEKKILEFVERMRRYNPFITFYNVFQEFGAKILKEFISGTYPCTFAPEEISLNYSQVEDYVGGVLKERTRKAKRLYQSLLKKGVLFAVLNREMTREQYGEVLEILKFHNLLEKGSSMKERYDFKIRVEPKGSPEFLIAGDATVCCMSFGSHKAKIYAEEKGFGILNVYYRDRVIANAVIWINAPYKCLVLDNIEVHPNYTKHSEILKECFLTAARRLTEEYGLSFAVQGELYNDLVLYESDSQAIKFAVLKPEEVKTKHFYTDAKRSRVIFRKIPEWEVETLEESISAETCGQAA